MKSRVWPRSKNQSLLLSRYMGKVNVTGLYNFNKIQVRIQRVQNYPISVSTIPLNSHLAFPELSNQKVFSYIWLKD